MRLRTEKSKVMRVSEIIGYKNCCWGKTVRTI